MFGKQLCIHFSVLLIVSLFSQINTADGTLAVPSGPFYPFALGYQIIRQLWKYGTLEGFGDKDPNNAVTKAEFAVQSLAESMGLPVNTERFEPVDYDFVRQLVVETLEEEGASIQGLPDPKAVLKTVDALESSRLELKTKLDEKKEVTETVIKELSGSVKGLDALVKELNGDIKNVLNAARTDALNASAAVEFYVKKLGFRMNAGFSTKEDEYILRKVNEVDGTVVVKVYTEKEKALQERFDLILEKVKYEQIYEKVLNKLNSEKKGFKTSNKKGLFGKETIPREKVKEILTKLNKQKVELDKHIGHVKSNEFELRAKLSNDFAEQVNGLNDSIEELTKILDIML